MADRGLPACSLSLVSFSDVSDIVRFSLSCRQTDKRWRWTMNTSARASCLCGGIVVDVDLDQITMINNCHCVNCRKVSGAAYGTFVQIKGSGFRWVEGDDLVKTYESSPGVHRAFCQVCGSRAPQSHNFGEHATVPAGMFDGDFQRKPQVNIWVDRLAEWHVDPSTLPSCEGGGTPAFWNQLFDR
jgi:hypothetical protein